MKPTMYGIELNVITIVRGGRGRLGEEGRKGV